MLEPPGIIGGCLRLQLHDVDQTTVVVGLIMRNSNIHNEIMRFRPNYHLDKMNKAIM